MIFTFLNFENTLELELEQYIFYRIKSCTNTQRHNYNKFIKFCILEVELHEMSIKSDKNDKILSNDFGNEMSKTQ